MAEPWKRREVIGDATLYLGDCRQILPTLPKVDAVVTDPPYSSRAHAGHDKGSMAHRDGSGRRALGYSFLTNDDVEALACSFTSFCEGWVVWMTDHTLAPVIRSALERAGRYVFAPLPFFQPGRSVRLTGDGPSSWTDWIVVARTSQQLRWGTLPGGYLGKAGWNDKVRMGGKPSALMDCLIRDYTRRKELVADPFMGAGTTGVSCVKSGRSFIGCDIDEKSFDIACRRIREAYAQPDLLVEAAKKPEQQALSL